MFFLIKKYFKIDAITDTFNGVWEASIAPGKYRIIVSKTGFRSVEVMYEAGFGTRVLKLPCAEKLSRD